MLLIYNIPRCYKMSMELRCPLPPNPPPKKKPKTNKQKTNLTKMKNDKILNIWMCTFTHNQC